MSPRDATGTSGPLSPSSQANVPEAPAPPDVLALALGDTEPAARRLVAERFSGARVRWLDRRQVARQPLRALRHALATRHADVLMYTPDRAAPRLRVTALLAAVPRARRRWLADPAGLVPFSATGHLRANGWPVSRHLLAVGVALAAARPLLRLAVWYLPRERRRVRWGRPARILYLRSQFWFGLTGGGSVGHTAGVIGGLREAGVEVAVVSSDALYGVQAPSCLVPPERWFDGRLKEAEELTYNGPFVWRALRVARAVRPDAVYQRYTAFSFAGALLSRVLGVPFVLEFNSSDVWKGRHWGELRLLGLAALGERVNLLAADRVVTVSRVLRDALVAAGVPAEKVLVTPNAVDPRRFRPDAPGAAAVRRSLGLGGACVVGFSGTFGVWHGIATLAEALPLVAAARPDVRFLLLGDGPLRPLVEDAVWRHGLQPRVTLAGLVPYDRMPDHLAACDVLLSPHGRQADGGEFFGSPTKLYEYMAAGRAIVASRVGQIGEALRDEDTALLVEPEDAPALAAAVLRLVDDPALRARLGAAARARAERAHTWRGNAERVLAALAPAGGAPSPAGTSTPSPPGRGSG